MATVPLAMIGVVLVLWLAGIPVTIMVFLGLIILVGIVVNNAIVLIDYINVLRRRGPPRWRPSSRPAGPACARFLMTALTTVVGLPMALGIGEGAEIRAPMAITVIVGLSAPPLLTLVVIPTLYSQFTSNRPLNGGSPERLNNRNPSLRVRRRRRPRWGHRTRRANEPRRTGRCPSRARRLPTAIPRFSVTRPVTVVMILATILVVGFIALQRIRLALFPRATRAPSSTSASATRTPPRATSRKRSPARSRTSSAPCRCEAPHQLLQPTGYSYTRVEFQTGTNLRAAYAMLSDRMDRVKPPAARRRRPHLRPPLRSKRPSR
jgi:Cu/Ag efflux pump CusA